MATHTEQRFGGFRTIVEFFALLLGVVIATSAAEAQSYFTASGTPTFVSPEAVEQGFTDAANGNLHLEFVFGSYPQRAAQTQTVKYVYDSNMVWNAGCSGSGCSWAPSNYNNYGWRLATAGGNLTGLNCGAGYQGGCPDWAFTDVLGTTRYFHVAATPCPVPNAYATDSSGYMLNLCQTAVYAPDGTNVYSSTYMQQAAPGVEDSNGNYVNPGSNYYGDGQDTLGRTLPYGIQNCNSNSNQICFQVPTSQNPNSQGASTYTVTTTTISVHTAFGQSGITEYTGTMTVVQSVALPDGTSYTFQYDCDSGSGNAACGSPSGQGAYYGLMTSMTLPTGGTVSYGYTTFNDSYSNKIRWLNNRTTVGGTWWYQPQVISTCTSTQVGCQQKVTVTAPSGDYKIYTFTLNNGAWPVTIQSYDSASNWLSTVTNTYDFSQPCVMYNCHGAAFIRLLTSQTSVPTPSGSLTKQTQYQYDSPQTGNITARQEWGYYPGSFPGVPDRATYTQYLTTGINDINRPTSITACNNAGSDSACPGGGTRVQQTLYTYDNYSGCASGLVSVTGVRNHDDTNFGSSYTTRGNPTLIQQWVSGSSYLNTQLCYDTTGQVVLQVDPKLNQISYNYADQFYADNGTSSPAPYTPSNPTNAYVTSVTAGGQTSTFGYYYGSGKRAFATDPNGATAYSHFMDPFDRSTENDYALTGWDKSVYTSSTQTDVYGAVNDSTPSTGCQSCQHSQVFFDNWGRKSSEKIANYPGGSVSSDTSYDVNGRIYSITHPYQGGSAQYEYFHYDGLDRTIQRTHPDSQYAAAFYGPSVTANGGLAYQLGASSTYGYGYPVLYKDEAGNRRQQWLDGFGRLIEVDEPMSAASGAVSVNGSEQSRQVQTGGATQATATISITGGEQHWRQWPCIDPPCSIYDSGDVYITMGGVQVGASYGQGSTTSSVASALASNINANNSFPATATASSASITLTSKAYGSAANLSFTTDYDYDNYDTDNNGNVLFTDPSFTITPSSGSLSGGSDGTYSTVYDSGTATITVNGHGDSYSWGSGDNTNSIAAGLAQAVNNDSSAPVTASASGTTVTVTAKDAGSGISYSLSASTTYDSSDFGSASFSFSNPNTLNGTSTVMLGTYYAYDAADHVTQVVQGIQTRSYAFDGLGRATSVTTPEAGTETFSWTGASAVCSGDPGGLCQKTDARGVVTTYFYDALNRLVGKSYSVPAGVAAMPNVCTTSTGQAANTCYFYDQGGAAANAVGRRTQMVDPSGSETYVYDRAGRVTQLTKVIGSNSYPISYQYNAADEITQITYPSGRTIQRSYNNVGQLCEIANATSSCGSSASPYATAYAYNAAGQLTGFNYGNGVAATFGYSTARAQLSSITYVKSPNTLFALNYWYQQDPTNCPSGATAGNNGQIQCITDGVDSGRSVRYAYDGVGRLTSATTNGSGTFPQWGLSWSYDRYGNRLSQNVTAGSGYQNSLSFGYPGGAQTNRPDGWCFDASGNLLAQTACPPASPIVYDGENHMVSDPAAGATYTYDGNGLRVQKCVSANCTVFIYDDSQDIAEYDNGAAPNSPTREFIYTVGLPGPSGLLASITGGTTTYFHPDHLGWRVSTDANGNVNGQQGIFPFGQSWYSSNGNQFVFTSYQNDSESGLDYALARYYDAAVARFCSVDPLGGQINDPQTLNRYAYGRNDPVNVTDPSGQGFWSWFARIFGIIGSAFAPELGPIFGFAEAAGDTAAAADAISTLGTFAQVVRIGMDTTPQGQSLQQQPQPANNRPVYCDPSVMAAMKAAWVKQIAGNLHKPNSTEAGFPAYRSASGGYQAGNGPGNKAPEIQTGQTTGFNVRMRSNAVAVFHTHPWGSSGLPSTPNNNAGESPLGDTGSAVKNATDIYVISQRGLSRAPATGPANPKWGKDNSPWVIEGNGVDDWLKKLGKKCDTM